MLKKCRLNYNNAGVHDIMHLETSSDLVKREDGTNLEAAVAVLEMAVSVLNGSAEGSVSKAVSDAVMSIVADSPEAFDTLKEFYDWTQTHATEASAMGVQIQANKTAIESLQTTASKIKEIVFTASNFTNDVYSIPATTHGMPSGAFLFQLYMNVNGVYCTGNWATTGTEVKYNADRSISITHTGGFAGKIVLIG